MEPAEGVQASTVTHPALAMTGAEQEQALALAQMAQPRALHPDMEESLGQAHLAPSEVPNLKYCR